MQFSRCAPPTSGRLAARSGARGRAPCSRPAAGPRRGRSGDRRAGRSRADGRCFRIPCRRQTSAVGEPASCSRSTPMICSSVNLLLHRPSPGDGLSYQLREPMGSRSTSLLMSTRPGDSLVRPVLALALPGLRLWLDRGWGFLGQLPFVVLARQPFARWITSIVRCQGVIDSPVGQGLNDGATFCLVMAASSPAGLIFRDLPARPNQRYCKGRGYKPRSVAGPRNH